MAEASKPNLYQRLNEVMKSVGYLKKDAQMKSGGSFSYASSTAVLTPIRDALIENGIILSTEIIDAKPVPGALGKMLLTEGQMRMTFINIDNPDDRHECLWYAQGADMGEKGPGKLATYGEKYFLLKFFHIPTDDMDPDAWANKQVAEADKMKAIEEKKKALAEARAKADNLSLDLAAIDNLPHLQNWGKKHSAEIKALPAAMAKEISADYKEREKEIKAALKQGEEAE